MGLAIIVGHLADLALGEPDEAEPFRAQLRALNEVLAQAGLPLHHEPKTLAKGDSFSCRMWGYAGLHCLRRIAAWDALGRGLPNPGDDHSSDDPIVQEYNQRALDDEPLPYRHLLLHSDCEGFYIPQDFRDVIIPDDERKIPGCMIGSTHQLLGECTKLAEILGLPLEVDPESDEMLEFVESQGQVGAGWQRYGIESFSCLQLVNASKASLKTGALILFS